MVCESEPSFLLCALVRAEDHFLTVILSAAARFACELCCGVEGPLHSCTNPNGLRAFRHTAVEGIRCNLAADASFRGLLRLLACARGGHAPSLRMTAEK
jgi:hypothetical protein